MTALPRVIVVNQEIGVSSQPWFWRRVRGYRRFEPVVLTWTRRDGGALDAHGIPIHCLDFDPEPNLLPGLGRWLHRLRCVPGGNFYATVGRERQAIVDWARAQAPAAFLCHFGPTALRMLPVAQALRRPLVAHFHGYDVSSSLRNRWYRHSLLRALPAFAACACVGSHQRRWLIEQGLAPERVHLIPSGVPCADFKPRTHEPTTAPLYLAVSRLVEGKGLEYTLEAFARVSRELPAARLIIGGEGPLQSRLEEHARALGAASAVEFLGSVAWQDIPDLMFRADVFVQHSLTASTGWVEGFGVSIAEASATGLPLVVTRSGGVMDQVVESETGLVVEERDVAGMAEAMLQLAHDTELRQRLGAAGRAHVCSKYDTPLMVSRLEEVLMRAIAQTS